MHFAQLVYGGPGAGKTFYGLSSFWDFEKRKQIRDGRILIVGSEDNNPFLLSQVPEACVKRFSSPSVEPNDALKFMEAETTGLYSYLRKLVSLKQKPEAIFFDGFSEWSAIFDVEHRRKFGTAEKDKWARFDALKQRAIDILQMLHPSELGAYVIASTRVGTYRKAITDKQGKVVVESDPEWMADYDYYPDVQGWTKRNIGHYFTFVNFMEEKVMPAPPGEQAAHRFIHKLYMLPVGEFWVKNACEREWLLANKPDHLVQPTFDKFLSEVDNAVGGTANS